MNNETGYEPGNWRSKPVLIGPDVDFRYMVIYHNGATVIQLAPEHTIIHWDRVEAALRDEGAGSGDTKAILMLAKAIKDGNYVSA